MNGIKMKNFLNIFYMVLVSTLLLSCTLPDTTEKSLKDVKTKYVVVSGNLSDRKMFNIIDSFHGTENRTIDEENGIYTKSYPSWPGYEMLGQYCKVKTTMKLKRQNENFFSLSFSIAHKVKSCFWINQSGVADLSNTFNELYQGIQKDVALSMKSKVVQEKKKKIVNVLIEV